MSPRNLYPPGEGPFVPPLPFVGQNNAPVKIAAVETILLQHKLARPTGPASVLNEWRRNLLVRITTNTGLVGWGETVPLGGVRDTIDTMYAPMLVGRDPRNIGNSWRTRWLAPFENRLAVGAIDIALHDLVGLALGVPVHQLYGGARRRRVPVYASGGGYFHGVHPADVWPAEPQGYVARGFRAIKLKIGRYDRFQFSTSSPTTASPTTNIFLPAAWIFPPSLHPVQIADKPSWRGGPRGQLVRPRESASSSGP
ncbi:MAG: hypothetical protein EXS38_12320 [Opitutus sp.]|nr:hypothetical protein [Opitutus sp.]